MKAIRQLSITLACALAASAAVAQTPVNCDTPTQLSAVRQANPGIDAAIAALPDSSLYGTINRLDAMYHRGQIDALPCGAGQAGGLPDNWVRGMDATLADLRDDLAADLNGDNLALLSDVDVANILKVVRLYAFRRNLALYDGNAFTYCPIVITPTCPVENPECTLPPPPPPCVEGNDDDPAIYDRLDEIIVMVRPAYTRVRSNLTPAQQGQLAPAAFVNGNNFLPQMGTLLTIKGVESIDD